MAKLLKTKFGFVINGDFYSLISITENKLKELLIFPSFAENYSEIEFGNPNADDPIKNQHYTVHNSPNSIDNINVLKHTLEFSNAEPKITRIFTRAFKQTNSLSPLYISRFQNILNERYKIKRNERDTYIDLGGYEPTKSTLFYMIIVGNSQNLLDENFKDININTIHFQKYSVSILWSFGIFPSHHTGQKLHFLTMPEYDCQLKEGFSDRDIIEMYRSHRQHLKLSFLNFIQKDVDLEEDQILFFKSIGFKKTPDSKLDDTDLKHISLNKAYEFAINSKKEKQSGNFKDALRFLDYSKEIFEKQGEDFAYANVLNSKGVLLQTIGFPKEAVNCYKESLGIFEKKKSLFHVARGTLNLSIVYRDTSENSKAMIFAKKSLKIAQNAGFISLEADAYREMGVLFKKTGKLRSSMRYFKKSIKKYDIDNNTDGKAFCYGNMGLLLALNGKISKSLKLHQEALSHFEISNHQLGIANETANIGNMNCSNSNFQIGISQLKTALKMHIAYGYKYGIATDLKLIGVHLASNLKKAESIDYLEKSNEILLQIGNQIESENILKLISQIKGK